MMLPEEVRPIKILDLRLDNQQYVYHISNHTGSLRSRNGNEGDTVR